MSNKKKFNRVCSGALTLIISLLIGVSLLVSSPKKVNAEYTNKDITVINIEYYQDNFSEQFLLVGDFILASVIFDSGDMYNLAWYDCNAVMYRYGEFTIGVTYYENEINKEHDYWYYYESYSYLNDADQLWLVIFDVYPESTYTIDQLYELNYIDFVFKATTFEESLNIIRTNPENYGLTEIENLTSFNSILENVFTKFDEIGQIEIFPGLKIIYLITIPLVLGLVLLILKLLV